jgi:hypothetical protein
MKESRLYTVFDIGVYGVELKIVYIYPLNRSRIGKQFLPWSSLTLDEPTAHGIG